MKPKVSVVIPSYNHGRYIAQTLASVTNQTYENLEIIVIDDGSSDNSCDIITKQIEPRITFIPQQNQGAHAAINRGLALATGDYITVLNSDDLFTSNRIETFIQVAESSDQPSIITSFIDVINPEGTSLGIKKAFHNMFPYEVKNLEKTVVGTSDPVKNLLMFNYVATTSNFFFDREIYQRIGNFCPLRYVHDWDYILRVIQHYPIHIVEEPLLQYRVHESNTIRENTARMILEICWVLAKNYPGVLSSLAKSAEKEGFFELFDQLYHSVQVFNCEKILLNLVLMFMTYEKFEFIDEQNQFDLEEILVPQNSYHQKLVQEIEEIIFPSVPTSCQSVAVPVDQTPSKSIYSARKGLLKILQNGFRSAL
jgi:glycosyltransferase involved in cell wall biosynthesis